MSNQRAIRWRCLPLLMLLLLTGYAWAEVCKGSKVPKADLAHYDAQAILSPADRDAALQTHLPYGQPACHRLLSQRERGTR